jgi:hypothetical protein
MAAEKAFQLFRPALGGLEPIVIEKFLTRLQVAESIDVDSTPVVASFAVWCARVVDPASFVAVDPRIDHCPILERKEEGVMRILGIVGGKLLRCFPGDALAGVFNDPSSLPNGLRRENPSAIDTRSTYPD